MTVSTLRHYDKAGAFVPAKRGMASENKYRYYSPVQITTLKAIRVLTEVRVPLNVIKELTQGRTPEKLIKLLSKYKTMVADEIRFLQDVHAVIGTYIDLLNEGISIMEDEISVAEMPQKQIILGNTNVFTEETSLVGEFTRFCKALHEPKLNMSFPVGGYWDTMTSFLDRPSQPTRFFSLDPKGYEQKPAGLYLIGYTRGYYGQTNGLPKRMEAYAKKNGLVFTGPVYNIFLFDDISVVDPEQYLLQVSASVKETHRVISRRPRRHF